MKLTTKPLIVNPLVVRKSNELIEATYKLSVHEQRLLIVLASAISPDDEDFKEYTITASDFARMFELELHSNLYDTLQNAANSLMKQQLKFRYFDEDNRERERSIQWLSYIDYIVGSGIIELSFDVRLKPYLLQLKGRFTQYRFEDIVKLGGLYSPRLYELLKAESFKAKNGKFERFFQIHELRLILGIEETAYPILNDLKLRVINPAVNEISLSSDLTVTDVKYGKTGRKITNVTFVVTVRHPKDEPTTVKPAITHELKPTTPTIQTDCPVINALVAHGMNPLIAKRIKANYEVERINRNIDYTIQKQKNGEVQNLPAYLKSAIEADYCVVTQSTIFDIASGMAKSEDNDNKVVAPDNKEQQAKQLIQDKHAKNQKAFDDFLLLPEARKEEIKGAFFENADTIIQAKIKEQEQKGIEYFASPFVRNPFKVFLSELN